MQIYRKTVPSSLTRERKVPNLVHVLGCTKSAVLDNLSPYLQSVAKTAETQFIRYSGAWPIWM